ncbi:MAG: Maf family nucleotide pyrophosphatase [Bacteroidia bacterium]|jgi:septum formation protein|nr:Maf family nucleotide pyrophosphatase [Bacteroidia bacterium]
MEKQEIILASKSPRRQELIKGLGLNYTVVTFEVDETFPAHLMAGEIAGFLAEKKANAYPHQLKPNEILVTADTIVWINNHVLNKPQNESEAYDMLSELCGTTHEVYTGVSIKNMFHQITFIEKSVVSVKAISDDEIRFYIQQYKPYDKAGAYGIQDWFGYVAVQSITGCFYNVMGLPVSSLYQQIKNLTKQHTLF